MELAGIFSALTIGLSLGLLGGGGSILTVPAMVYLLGVSPVLATAYSLFVVGAVALIGAFNNMRKGLISFKTAIVFAIPSLIAVFLTRLYLIPAIPEEIITLGGFILTKQIAIMMFFAIIMLIASISMIRSKDSIDKNEGQTPKFNYQLIMLDGLLVGTLTGIVGAGGGFLIIPALVLLAKLPMKLAVGTSLLIISIKSLLGFVGDLQSGQLIDWSFLLSFTGIAVLGIFLGAYLSNFISGKKLKKTFGWFVLIMAISILIKELLNF